MYGLASIPVSLATMLADGFIPFVLDTSGSWRVVTLLVATPLAFSAVLYGALGDSTPLVF